MSPLFLAVTCTPSGTVQRSFWEPSLATKASGFHDYFLPERPVLQR